MARADGPDPAFLNDVLAGMALPQKAVPARWFYDEAGSHLFEEITQLPEYYPTRTETAILRACGGELGAQVGPGRAVVEFGSGSSLKTPLVLDAIAPAAYVPIDISGDFLRASSASLGKRMPDLAIHPVEADFMHPVALPVAVADMPKLGFFPGSTIGNLTPFAATELLRSMAATLGDDAQLLIGFDLIKDQEVLIAAYDDAAGVTARFNLNLLHRINREAGGTMPVDAFRHNARWNDPQARIEMHLVARRAVSFEIAGRSFAMAEGESIHTENSHKFSPRSAALLLAAGGWRVRSQWADENELFAVMLAEIAPPTTAP